MQLLSESTSDGVRQRDFLVGEIAGVLWSPRGSDDSPVAEEQPLILIGHGGGQHKHAPGVVARAKRFASQCRFAVVAIDAPGHGDRQRSADDERSQATVRRKVHAGEPVESLIEAYNAKLAKRAVPEWQSVLDDILALRGHNAVTPVGYWGVSLGGAIGVALVAAEPRVSAAVIGLIGDETSQAAATRVTIPIQFVLQWDDELVPRHRGLALFDALASSEKTLHANSGRHVDVPRFEIDSAERFFIRHLVGTRAESS